MGQIYSFGGFQQPLIPFFAIIKHSGTYLYAHINYIFHEEVFIWIVGAGNL